MKCEELLMAVRIIYFITWILDLSFSSMYVIFPRAIKMPGRQIDNKHKRNMLKMKMWHFSLRKERRIFSRLNEVRELRSDMN